MGFRFSRRLRILPGLRLNLGRRGVSVSVGVKGAHITLGTSGRRATIGLPGTGVSYTAYRPTHHSGVAPVQPSNPPPVGDVDEIHRSIVPSPSLEPRRSNKLWWVVVLFLVFLLFTGRHS